MPDDGRKTDLHSAGPAPHKFSDPSVTAKGETRATVTLERLDTLWINTGTLCNIECAHCYIESSPRNDHLAYITTAELMPYLAEARRLDMGTTEIGFTGGEPFMNPDMIEMLDAVLTAGHRALVLTNAMKPMTHKRADLLDLRDRFGDALELRVSLDHFSALHHEEERGPGTFATAMDGLKWLSDEGFSIAVAGRTRWGEPLEAERAGYADLFAREGIRIDASDPARLVLFPEMDESADVPEITTACWGILGKTPSDVMCASSRMIVKRKGAERPAVVACTLLPYDPRFELGATLQGSEKTVPLNHPHCARFCVLGGASCSA
ncbi:Radical SAM domain protein [Caenispirillum salinarum AK4]|uniref:Radical SAM domain protein n=1 Tax=Caenispirillum salinarum AK4 TaxID=1238182 RepID=K9GVE1_9PROT|nr:radical SAM protein [Caenispirillum salinarum]EKV29142.1 Radical SAM domain protein [Caenispirillum salinarum AK4]